MQCWCHVFKGPLSNWCPVKKGLALCADWSHGEVGFGEQAAQASAGSPGSEAARPGFQSQLCHLAAL